MTNKNGKYVIMLLVLCLGLSACGKEEQVKERYINITAEEAKKVMDETEGYILLDVRTQEEYDKKHIPGAVLIPYDEIEKRAEEELPDVNQTILVYCRSGNRSKTASETLYKMGYQDIREFGGINDWPYDVE